jgi:hypothetical protein
MYVTPLAQSVCFAQGCHNPAVNKVTLRSGMSVLVCAKHTPKRAVKQVVRNMDDSNIPLLSKLDDIFNVHPKEGKELTQEYHNRNLPDAEIDSFARDLEAFTAIVENTSKSMVCKGGYWVEKELKTTSVKIQKDLAKQICRDAYLIMNETNLFGFKYETDKSKLMITVYHDPSKNKYEIRPFNYKGRIEWHLTLNGKVIHGIDKLLYNELKLILQDAPEKKGWRLVVHI